jgi:hypothetical protein
VGEVRSSPAEFAWRVHSALEAWTAKVDMKASILLAFQGGAFIFAATSRDVVLDGTDRRPAMVAALGAVMLVTATALAATAILPFLGSTRAHRAARVHEWIYFGHLRLWDPAELALRLSRLTIHDEVQALSAQLVRMSRLNWRKHRLLQGSVALTLSAMTVMLVAVVIRAGAA